MKQPLLNCMLMTAKCTIYSFILQCLFLTALSAHNANAQGNIKKVFVETGFTDAALAEVFKVIENKTDFKFSYHKEDIEKRRSVRINMAPQKRSVADILFHVSGEAGLKFKQVGGYIAVSPKPNWQTPEIKPAIPANGTGGTNGHSTEPAEIVEIRVSGKVTDEGNEPLIGVTIVLKDNPGVGTVTDFNGEFTMDVPGENAILVFSYLGYADQEISLGGRNLINVQLLPDQNVLDEVIVVAYGETSRQKLTGSVQTVGAEKLDQVPVASFDRMLQGQAAGVLVTPSNGAPGGAATIYIRGIGSISASNQPLYVVDGVPINSGVLDITTQTYNALATINPNEIESVTILKDASAASIYGSRAANGVVLITTKKGKAGKTEFTFRTQHGVSDWENSSNFRTMNAREYIELMREGVINAGFNPDDPTNASMYFPLNADTLDINWFEDFVFQTGLTHQYELSASGGNEKTRFFVSGALFDQEGIAINTDLRRISTRLNIDHSVSDRFNFGAKISLAHNTQHSRFGTSNLNEPLYGGLFVPPNVPVFATEEQVANGDDLGTGYNYDIPPGLSGHNPIAYSDLNGNETRTARVIGKIYGGYSILPGLTFKTSLGIDYVDVREQEDFSQTYLDGIGSSNIAVGREIFSNNFDYTFTNTLSYSKDFDGGHGLRLLAGSEFQKSSRETIDAQARAFPSDEVDAFDTAAEPIFTRGRKTASALWGLFAKASYDFDRKYLLDLTFRRDGSSKFGSNTRFGNFWSVGVGYNVSNESFMKGSKLISTLKLRASVGTSGNEDIGSFTALRLYSFRGAVYNTTAGANSGSYPSQLGNPDLSWEKNLTVDGAIDIGFLDDRINASIELYRRKTSDMLLDVPVSRTSGVDEVPQNIGELENKGIELSLNTLNLKLNNGIRWSTAFQIAFNKNEVTALPEDADIIFPLNSTTSRANTIIREGQPIYAWYMPVWAGVDPANGRPLWYDDSGNIVTNFGDADRQVVGSPHPDFFGSLTNVFDYKGFSLAVMFYFNYGNDIFRHSARAMISDGSRFPRNQDARALNRWQKPGDITDTPRYVANNADGGENASTRWLEDGSFIKLRSVTLAYQVPSTFLQKIKLDNARIYLQGQNLKTWTEFREFDPETGFNSNARGEYPIPRTITMGLDIGF